MCSGLVNISQTSARGASKSRVMRISQSDGVVITSLFFALILLVLLLQRFQVVVEAIEAFLPEPPIPLDVAGDLLKRLGVQSTRAPLRVASADDEARALEHLEVLRDRREAHLERGGELRYRDLALREPREDGASGRIGESSECRIEILGHLRFNLLVN